LRRADHWDATWRAFTLTSVYNQVGARLLRTSPALVLAFPVTLVTYAVWPRTRYFGNTAPLLGAVIFLVAAIAHPHVAGAAFLVAAVPFIFIFVSGVLADLMETSYRPLIVACVVAMLVTYVARTLMA